MRVETRTKGHWVFTFSLPSLYSHRCPQWREEDGMKIEIKKVEEVETTSNSNGC
ncbi:hypothetical protein [Bailinhaonella thermotolerans]|uniref:hypothetical protein n=1 Tax=Bailinhaonella thermotolerans TaxID=1070861 RepID=UPI00192A4A85|nr:hypothetical protein [Bailinhaonella thermotolerans]